ncbi:hypothetical protein OG900_37865 [Streptomyces sp. NBC_00433]
MDPHLLRTFTAVARLGSFSAAGSLAVALTEPPAVHRVELVATGAATSLAAAFAPGARR